jgi:hypothetical protein
VDLRTEPPEGGRHGKFSDRRGNGNELDRNFSSIRDAWDVVSYPRTKIATWCVGVIHCQCVRSLKTNRKERRLIDLRCSATAIENILMSIACTAREVAKYAFLDSLALTRSGVGLVEVPKAFSMEGPDRAPLYCDRRAPQTKCWPVASATAALPG